MNVSPRFGSTFHVSTGRTPSTKEPQALYPKMSTIEGFEQHDVASGFAPSPRVEPFAFSVPNEQDDTVKQILDESGYAFQGNGSFLEGGGCMGISMNALKYTPKLDVKG